MNVDTAGNKPLVILSAYTDNRDEFANTLNHRELERQIKNNLKLEYGVVDGSYKGKQEKAILVEYAAEEDFQLLIRLAKFYRQESVLAISKDREATLLFMDTHNFEKLGKLEAVPELVAKQQDAWTRTKNGQYYIVRNQDDD